MVTGKSKGKEPHVYPFSRIVESDVLHIFGQMVSAIRYMHSKNVLHRDLKTANIFLTKVVRLSRSDW